jgi:hypothetical protein
VSGENSTAVNSFALSEVKLTNLIVAEIRNRELGNWEIR